MKLLFILLLGLGFNQNVTQRTIDVTIEDLGYTDLSTIFSEYDLEWALINIIQCPTESCYITPNDEQSHNHRTVVSSGVHMFRNRSTLFVDGDNTTLRFGFNLAGTHTIGLLVTAEFPEEDTGYIEEGFDFCLVEGNNLVAFPCDNPVSVETAIPELARAEITQIIGAGVAATNFNGQFVGSLSNFTPASGYWFKSNSNMCFNYTCAE
ncbi:MAG: hypothetical protein CMG59_00915 [Candidatus Marinimicrobia bacterium]|nr:hypothetical protein [Candidatus Neomarinimicrobiota bacterium]